MKNHQVIIHDIGPRYPQIDVSAENLKFEPPPASQPSQYTDSGNPYTQHYQPTAAIWALYLKETEAEDKELAQLWQIGLDQLLIFVCQLAFFLLLFD